MTYWSAVLENSFMFERKDSHSQVEIIRHWGYPVESHDVVTDEGFVLEMLRIPYGRGGKGEGYVGLE